jgi:trk system potassium uptake protein
MGLGGSMCSTTGGIKALRLGVIIKGLKQDIKQLMMPENSLHSVKFHHLRTIVLEDKHVRLASMIMLLYLGLYLFGTLVGVCYGYSFIDSLFESVSAAANVGLSSGITAVGMPALLKVTYIVQMWLGRLEFISAFILLGIIMAVVRGRS